MQRRAAFPERSLPLLRIAPGGRVILKTRFARHFASDVHRRLGYSGDTRVRVRSVWHLKGVHIPAVAPATAAGMY